ncbi:MAG: SPOR domain-containing protein [Paludibacteraceae bacterium]|nr:SPOR domain-containing protein [Paludibacteraceae bacterium]
MKLLIVILLTILNLFPGVQVVQDSTVSVLLDETINGAKDLVEVDGYRVQVYSSNKHQTAKAEALELEAELKDKIGQPIYVQYVSPFWKVRLGNFRTYEEAKEYKKLFVQQFPKQQGNTYIVRDKIQIKEE